MIPCGKASRLLLDSAREMASEPQLLELEEHLGRCEACRAERARLQLFRSLREAPAPSLDERAHERILRTLRQEVSTPQPKRWNERIVPWLLRRSIVVPCGLALVLLAGAALWWSRHVGASSESSVPLLVADQTLLSMEQPGAFSFAGSLVQYTAGTSVRVRGAERTLELHQGMVDVDVTAGGPRRYRVVTPQFVVEVLGTRFVVALDGVRTLRGVVRIVDLAGKELSTVRAGESWKLPVEEPHSEILPTPVPEPVHVPQRAPEHVHVSLDELLRAARTQLATGEIEAARQTLVRARRLARTPPERGEIAFLDADLLRLQGHRDEALSAYRRIVTTWPELPAAERASFLVGEVLAEAGSASEARTALEQYLARYPDGLFAEDARLRLRSLGPATP